MGAQEGETHPFQDFLNFFFLGDKTLLPNVFSSCSFTPYAHFQTSLVMIRYYGYEIWRHKKQVVKLFLSENAGIFQLLAAIKVNIVDKNEENCLFLLLFDISSTKFCEISPFYLISNSWKKPKMATMFGDVTGLTTMAVIPEIHIPLGN